MPAARRVARQPPSTAPTRTRHGPSGARPRPAPVGTGSPGCGRPHPRRPHPGDLQRLLAAGQHFRQPKPRWAGGGERARRVEADDPPAQPHQQLRQWTAGLGAAHHPLGVGHEQQRRARAEVVDGQAVTLVGRDDPPVMGRVSRCVPDCRSPLHSRLACPADVSRAPRQPREAVGVARRPPPAHDGTRSCPGPLLGGVPRCITCRGPTGSLGPVVDAQCQNGHQCKLPWLQRGRPIRSDHLDPLGEVEPPGPAPWRGVHHPKPGATGVLDRLWVRDGHREQLGGCSRGPDGGCLCATRSVPSGSSRSRP